MFERNVTLQTLPVQEAYAIEHRGDYPRIDAAFSALAQWAGARGLLGPQTRWIGIFYDNPDTVPPAELRSQACIVPPTLSADVAAPVSRITLRGGDYAVLRHRGPYSTLKEAYMWLYGEWLPRSGRHGAAAPPFELYLNTPDTTAPEDLLTDIHAPID